MSPLAVDRNVKNPNFDMDKVCKYCICAFFQVITVYTFIGMKSPTYDDYEYPAWVVVLFWGLNLSSVLAIPICSIHTLFHLRGSFLQVYIAVLAAII